MERFKQMIGWTRKEVSLEEVMEAHQAMIAESNKFQPAFEAYLRELHVDGITAISGSISGLSQTTINIQCQTEQYGTMKFTSQGDMGGSYNRPDPRTEDDARGVLRTSKMYQEVLNALRSFCSTNSLGVPEKDRIRFIYGPVENEPHPETPTTFDRPIVGFEIKLEGRS